LAPKNIYIILGGGVHSDGSLPDHVINRVNLISDKANKGDMIIASSSFSLNIPPKLDKKNYIIFESTQIARELNGRGFNNVITENWSHDTIGSAMFCRMLIESLSFKHSKVYVVTSDFHFERASNIFKWAFNILKPRHKEIELLSVKTFNISKKEITTRFQKEKESTISFEKNFKNISSFNNALLALLLKHDNYNTILSSKNKNEISMY